jgi:hypothetical protein
MMNASEGSIPIRPMKKFIAAAFVAAAKKAKKDGNDRQLMALRNVLLTLSSAEGITAHRLSDFNLWDVD